MSYYKTSPKELAKWYSELDKNGNGFSYHENNSTELNLNGPNLNTRRLVDYVVIPKLNLIDLSICINSGIDMEFFNDTNFNGEPRIGELTYIKDLDLQNGHECCIYTKDGINNFYCCRIRRNKWQHWEGSKTPLPTGVTFDVVYTDGTIVIDGHKKQLVWNLPYHYEKSIKAFRVTGEVEGWIHGWEIEK